MIVTGTAILTRIHGLVLRMTPSLPVTPHCREKDSRQTTFCNMELVSRLER